MIWQILAWLSHPRAPGQLAATSPRPRTTGPPTWSTRLGEADLTQAWRGQRSYDRPDTDKVGKVDTPYLQVRASPQGPRTACAYSADTEAGRVYWASTRFPTNILALEGGPMSQERPLGNSGVEHRPEPIHSQPTEEVTAAAPTPNRFWRMMTDLGFPSPASNPASFIVTAEAFLGLTSQVQALAGMVQTIVPYLPQLMHSATHQPTSPTAHPQTESLVARAGGPRLKWNRHGAKSRQLVQPPRLWRQLGRKVAPAIRFNPGPTSIAYRPTPPIP
ncbi:hypothetical protein B296_00014638 [Ensete ventricosum]|uniref:Uncharacterized protein n=1 Tax=Ensete ventricosum TaxID=4639 RepID=A0A427AQK9_ENSVE|nr:hypothetical protein B296_00014638 [Ensete ventricosum]